MLDNLITDKFDVLDNIEVVDTAIKRDLFLSKAKELSDTIDSFKAADMMTEDNDSQLDDNLQIELNRGQELLRKILDEQVAVNASIVASRKQIHELNTDVLSFKENEKNTNVINSVELIENDAQICKIQKSHQKYVERLNFLIFKIVSLYICCHSCFMSTLHRPSGKLCFIFITTHDVKTY
jgi:hypothetical protein